MKHIKSPRSRRSNNTASIIKHTRRSSSSIIIMNRSNNHHVTAQVKFIVDLNLCLSPLSSPGYPIHSFCNSRNLDESTKLDILRILIRAYPESLHRESRASYLPIHSAAQCQSANFCQLLIEAYPESIRIGTAYGQTSLYLACREGNYDAVQYLYKMYPQAINIRSDTGVYPLHGALYGSAGMKQMRVVSFLLNEEPSCASRTTTDGELPLHIACNGRRNAIGSDVVGLLFDTYPEAIQSRDRVGKSPLDIAKESSHDEGRLFLMEQLGNFFLYASRISDLEQEMPHPLHDAVRNHVTLGVIKLLMGRYPGLEHGLNECGARPLHVACEIGSVSIVHHLVQLDSTCLASCDSRSNYPLHYACRGGNVSVVKYLLTSNEGNYYRGSISERNDDNKLPIQLLIEAGEKMMHDDDDPEYTEAIWCLLLAYPETVMNY